MAGTFNRDEVADLLVKCRRRCCICHRFCGVKIETDHMDPNGGDSIKNAIPVCFECHAEIHTYNPKHPRGRKYTLDELRKHKSQWLRTCKDHPQISMRARDAADVGPLQALIDELEFNELAAATPSGYAGMCHFLDAQFQRAIQAGALATLEESLKSAILEAYLAMHSANFQLEIARRFRYDPTGFASQALVEVSAAISKAKPEIKRAHQQLLEFLGHDGPPKG